MKINIQYFNFSPSSNASLWRPLVSTNALKDKSFCLELFTSCLICDGPIAFTSRAPLLLVGFLVNLIVIWVSEPASKERCVNRVRYLTAETITDLLPALYFTFSFPQIRCFFTKYSFNITFQISKQNAFQIKKYFHLAYNSVPQGL